jgi:TatD DNase family protein
MIDFHCHLDLYPNPLAVRDECERLGLEILSVTTTPSAWKGTSTLASRSRLIRTALGLHPQLAHERHQELALFDSLVPDSPYVGEIGLDGSPEFRDHWQTQLTVFRHILDRCSKVGGRILSIHSRRASRPVLECLEEFSTAGKPILHWFSGSLRELERAISLGCWFSVGPAMLSGEKGRVLVSRMPRERVLTESDGPFAQLRGAPMMPWDVEGSFQQLGDIWSVPPANVKARIERNLHDLLAMRGRQGTVL